MKMDMNTPGFQVMFQGLRALAGLGLVGGIAIFFVETGTGVLVQSWDRLAQASDILINVAG